MKCKKCDSLNIKEHHWEQPSPVVYECYDCWHKWSEKSDFQKQESGEWLLLTALLLIGLITAIAV
jgi:hypothetical protein